MEPTAKMNGVTYGPAQTATDLVADWRARAACSGYPNAIFFPVSEDTDQEAVDRARAICAVCPVSQACLEYALESNQRAGIWGGTTERERKSLRRRWLAERRRTI